MNSPLIQLESLSVTLGRRRILEGIDLSVGQGELVGLVGPNGSGKTTLLRAALGLVPHSGEVSFGGDPRGQLTPLQRARKIAFIPQQREIAWPLRVEAIVALGRVPYRGHDTAQQSQAAINRAIDRTDLNSVRERPALELSGGEQARVLIARALAQETPVLIADEPAASLDPAHQLTLMKTFRERTREGGTVLVSLHDLGLAGRFCDRIVMLSAGHLVADGAPQKVLTQKRLLEVYRVHAFIDRDADGLLILPTGLDDGGPGMD